LMSHAEATLLYLNEFRSYMLAYIDGEQRVATWVERSGKQKSGASDKDQWLRYQQLAVSPELLEQHASYESRSRH